MPGDRAGDWHRSETAVSWIFQQFARTRESGYVTSWQRGAMGLPVFVPKPSTRRTFVALIPHARFSRHPRIAETQPIRGLGSLGKPPTIESGSLRLHGMILCPPRRLVRLAPGAAV